MRILHEFDYRRPGTLEEALALLAEYGDKASPIAGGTDLVVHMKYRGMMQLIDGAGTSSARFPAASRVPAMLKPAVVVSISGLKELKNITTNDGIMQIGPGVTMTQLAGFDQFPPALLALRDAARAMGSPLIRNRATFGGNIINARPAADSAVAAVAVGGKLLLASAAKKRSIHASEFFTGPGESVRRADELLVSIELPYNKHEGSAYMRQGTRRQLEIALACAASWVRIDPVSGNISSARICLGAVAPTPVLAPKSAGSLLGQPPTAEKIEAAADLAPSEAKPIDDYRGSAEYRREMIKVLVRRTLETAVSRAGGKGDAL
jgi:carbon-monoxide dehydrogenase medium subunit